MTSPLALNEDFEDLLRELDRAGVEFVVVGAHALAAHGLPRATGDLDVLVRPDPANAPRVLSALRAFGAPLATHSVGLEDFLRPGVVYQLGLPPRRIDLLTEISGVTFEEAWAGRLHVRRPRAASLRVRLRRARREALGKLRAARQAAPGRDLRRAEARRRTSDGRGAGDRETCGRSCGLVHRDQRRRRRRSGQGRRPREPGFARWAADVAVRVQARTSAQSIPMPPIVPFQDVDLGPFDAAFRVAATAEREWQLRRLAAYSLQLERPDRGADAL